MKVEKKESWKKRIEDALSKNKRLQQMRDEARSYLEKEKENGKDGRDLKEG
jgi:hypothetical protein